MKLKFLIMAVLLSVVAISTQSCYKPFRLNGNGDVQTSTRQSFSFDAIDNQADFNVYVEHDSIFQIVVQAEANLIPHIMTNVNGNTLIIDTKANLHNNYPINIYVKTPTLNNITLSGSGLIQTDTIVTDHFSVNLSGSGDINGSVVSSNCNINLNGSGSIFYNVVAQNTSSTISGSGIIDLSGSSGNGNHVISGSGDLNSFSFLQNIVDAKISGSGNMFISVSEHLDATISGSGSIYYVGNPTTNINISGSGSVIRQ